MTLSLQEWKTLRETAPKQVDLDAAADVSTEEQQQTEITK